MENIAIATLLWFVGFFLACFINSTTEFHWLHWTALIFVWPFLLLLDAICWLIALEEFVKTEAEEQLRKLVEFLEQCKGITR